MARRLLPLSQSGWRLAAARAALLWESLWPALWPATGLVLLFAVLAAFDLPSLLPPSLHAALLVGFLVGLAASVIWAARRVVLPGREAARRRLERDSGLSHRPLQALEDRLAGAETDPFTAAMWQAHRRRMEAAAGSLRLGWPRAGLVAADPFALRAALSLLLLLGVLAAGNDFWPRVGRALTLRLDGSGPVAAVAFDLWINPPEYTQLPPIYAGSAVAAKDGDKTIAVPVGSTVLAQVHGGDSAPALVLDGKPTLFEAAGEGNYSINGKIGEATQLAVSQGGATLARYPLRIIPDQPPTASWSGSGAAATPRGALRLGYAATDDYGVKSLTLEIRRDGSDEAPVELPIAVPSQTKDIKSVTFQDLTASPWAGLPVEMRLTARDAIGQAGTSAPLKLTLPERVFHNPVARAIIDQRKLLARDPSQSDVAAETLGDLSQRPQLFNNDIAVFLALRTAVDALTIGAGHADMTSLSQLLWDTAERVEDGDLPQAQKSLRQAQQALQEALDRNASDSEIEKLTRELQDAVRRYLQAMMENAQKNGQHQATGNNGNTQTVTPQDIQKLLDQARDLARSGAKDAAKQALAQLQDMLELLQTAQPGDAEAQRRGQEAMRKMQDLAQKQQQLMDKAYREAQRGGGDPSSGEQNDSQEGQEGQQGEKSGTPRPGQGNSGGQDLAGAQEGLRKQLGDLMRKLGENGEIPQSFGRAERSMRNAEGALQHGDPGEAVKPQGEALDQLQQAMREMAEKMSQGSQGQGSPQQAGRDPFGRSGDIDSGDIKIPADAEIQRSREILDELRRRAGERDRPQIERDYINRLLERF